MRVVGDGQVLRAEGDVPDEGLPARSDPGFATVDAGGGKWRILTIADAARRPVSGALPSR